MAKKRVKSEPRSKAKAKTKSKPKSRSKPKMKLDKKSPLLAVSQDTSNLKSDEPSIREGSYTPELSNEDDIEEQEDSEGKGFYGGREEEGI
mgnify:FL=1